MSTCYQCGLLYSTLRLGSFSSFNGRLVPQYSRLSLPTLEMILALNLTLFGQCHIIVRSQTVFILEASGWTFYPKHRVLMRVEARLIAWPQVVLS